MDACLESISSPRNICFRYRLHLFHIKYSDIMQCYFNNDLLVKYILAKIKDIDKDYQKSNYTIFIL